MSARVRLSFESTASRRQLLSHCWSIADSDHDEMHTRPALFHLLPSRFLTLQENVWLVMLYG